MDKAADAILTASGSIGAPKNAVHQTGDVVYHKPTAIRAKVLAFAYNDAQKQHVYVLLPLKPQCASVLVSGEKELVIPKFKVGDTWPVAIKYDPGAGPTKLIDTKETKEAFVRKVETVNEKGKYVYIWSVGEQGALNAMDEVALEGAMRKAGKAGRS